MSTRHGAAVRLAQLRADSEQCLADFSDFSGAPVARRDALRERLRLALELRWKLEEQLVIPALGKRVATLLLPAAESESTNLRELFDHAGREASGVILPVARLALLRAERIELAVAAAEQRRDFDAAALVRDIDAMLARWRVEVWRTGDIEDEESDPVGQPPR